MLAEPEHFCPGAQDYCGPGFRHGTAEGGPEPHAGPSVCVTPGTSLPLSGSQFPDLSNPETGLGASCLVQVERARSLAPDGLELGVQCCCVLGWPEAGHFSQAQFSLHGDSGNKGNDTDSSRLLRAYLHFNTLRKTPFLPRLSCVLNH